MDASNNNMSTVSGEKKDNARPAMKWPNNGLTALHHFLEGSRRARRRRGVGRCRYGRVMALPVRLAAYAAAAAAAAILLAAILEPT